MSNAGASSYTYATRPVLYLKPEVQIESGDGTSTNPYKLSLSKNEDTSGANKPVLASNMIPVYYDAIAKAWKKADVKNIKIKRGCKKHEFSTSPFRGMRRSYAKFV